MIKTKILFVPGWTYTETKIKPFYEALKKITREVEWLQVPGLTGEKLIEPWSLEDYRCWLERELVSKVGEGEKVILIGHSNGGRIILKFLSTESEQRAKIAKVVLIDSAGLVDRRWHKVLKRDFFGLCAKLGKKLKNQPQLRKLVYKILRERDYYQADAIMQKTMANLLSEDLRTQLTLIKPEVLLIWGENDQMTPLQLGKEMAKKIPRARLQIIKGARHVPQITNLTETIRIITDFLTIDEKKKEKENG